MAAVLRGVWTATPLTRFAPILTGAQIKYLNTAAFADKGQLTNIHHSSYNFYKETNSNTLSVKFSPNSINLFNESYNKKLPIVDMPRLPISTILPVISNIPVIEDPGTISELDCPTNDTKNEKQAARMIVIRRRKMRRHKLRKLRKRMKYEWAKRDERRRIKKEKRFQMMLFRTLKSAEQFSAEEYVSEKLRKANEIPIPSTWKGRRLPSFLIRQYMGLDPKVEYKQFKCFDKNNSRKYENKR